METVSLSWRTRRRPTSDLRPRRARERVPPCPGYGPKIEAPHCPLCRQRDASARPRDGVHGQAREASREARGREACHGAAHLVAMEMPSTKTVRRRAPVSCCLESLALDIHPHWLVAGPSL
jgi:hypothetical protein